MPKKKVIIILLLAAAILGIVAIRRRPKTVSVSSVDIEDIVVKKTVSASGVVTSVKEIDLAFTAIGTLQQLLVEKGDEVSKGQLLASVYNYDSLQSVQAEKDDRDIAMHDLNIYIENYETYPNAVGGRDEYELNLRRMKELLSKAEATYQQTLGTLSKKYLYAPFTGTVVDIFSDEGEIVTAGGAVIKLADLGNLVFEISVDQEDFGNLELGQIVEVALDSYSNVKFSGAVAALPKYADDESEEFEIKIALKQDPDNPILLNMKGDASIIIESTQTPVAAVNFDNIYYNGDSGPFVWINSREKLQKHSVEIGLEGDIYTEIKTDLSDLTLVSPDEPEDASEGLKIKTNGK